MAWRALILAVAFGLALTSRLSQGMATGDPGFFSVCKDYLPIADRFADACRNHAREQTRYFNGEPETRFAYFADGPTSSHFGLGCVLGATGKIAFLGIYYSTNSENFILANTARLRFIDGFNNVGIVVNNEPVTLVAVRRLVTDLVPPPFPAKWAKNCEGENAGSDSPVRGPYGSFVFSEASSHGSTAVQWCMTGDANRFCKSLDYISFFDAGPSEIIYGYLRDSFLIKASGELLIERSIYHDGCTKYYDHRMAAPNLAQELCH